MQLTPNTVRTLLDAAGQCGPGHVGSLLDCLANPATACEPTCSCERLVGKLGGARWPGFTQLQMREARPPLLTGDPTEHEDGALLALVVRLCRWRMPLGDRKAVSDGRHLFEEVLQTMLPRESLADDVEMGAVKAAVADAMNNAVGHGTRPNDAPPQLEVCWHPESLLVCVWQGKSIAHLPPPGEPDGEAECGRGLLLMRQIGEPAIVGPLGGPTGVLLQLPCPPPVRTGARRPPPDPLAARPPSGITA